MEYADQGPVTAKWHFLSFNPCNNSRGVTGNTPNLELISITEYINETNVKVFVFRSTPVPNLHKKATNYIRYTASLTMHSLRIIIDYE